MSKILLSERLRLRPPELSDASNLYRLDGNPNVMRFIGSGLVKSKEDSAAYLARIIELSTDRMGYWVAESRYTKVFLGLFLIKSLDDTNKIELGYRLAEEHWNKGFATEGGQLMVHYAQEILQLKELVAVTVSQNVASQQVLTKLGFQHAGQAHYYQMTLEYFSKIF